MKTINALALATLIALGAPQVADAQSTKTVSFARGATTATVANVVSGSRYIDYKVTAKAGQAMTVQLISTSPHIRFNVYLPASNGRMATLYDSRGAARTYSDVLPETGTYTIRAYITTDVNRRNVVAPFRLRVTIPPAIVSNPQPDDDGHGPDQWVITGVAGLLNVRSGPSTNYGVVGTVRNGSVVTNGGCRGTGSARWCKITAHTSNGVSVNGWVSGTYLREYSGGSTPTPTPDPAPTTKYWQIWNVTTAANVRSGPGTSYSRVGSIARGNIVENLGCTGSWCKVQSLAGTGATVTGWISTPYLREYTAR